MKKTFQGWLLLDWKTGKMKVGKKIVESRLKGSEIPIKLNFEIEIPEKPVVVAEGKITLSETTVQKIVAEMV
jgi:hypothetical protein